MGSLPAPFDLIPHLWRPALVTLQVSGLGALLGAAMAFLAGLSMLSRFWPVRVIARTYTEVFRGTAVIVQLFWIFFVLPLVTPYRLTPLQAGMLALGLNIGAYAAEVVRGAVQSIPKGQVEAGIALNFTPWQRRRRIVIPQALILMLPAFGNNIIEMLKASALVGLIGLTDLTRQSQLIRSNLGRTGDVFLLVLLLFFLISTLFLTVTRYLERRFSRGMDMGMAARGIK
jgi:polar amino acid transport system permease protein